MKSGTEKAMFSPSFPHSTEDEEDENVLKEEEEEKSVSGDTFVQVKLEDGKDGQEGAERNEQPSGCGSELELSLFAPIDSEDAEEERPLTLTPPAGPDEDAGSSQRLWRGRRKRTQSRDRAAQSRTRTTDAFHDHAPPEKRAKPTFSQFPPHETTRSAVWEYFEYFINQEGELEDYGYPTCKMCQQKVACKRGNTSHMLRHLREAHAIAYKEVKKTDAMSLDSCEDEDHNDTDDNDPDNNNTEDNDTDDSDTDDSDTDDSENSVPATPRNKWQFGSLLITLPKGDESNKVYPPSTPRKSAVWKLFGFVMNNEGVLEENDFPVCRLCHQAVASKGGTTSNMYSHLQHHHHAVYIELKKTMTPAGAEQTLDLPEGTELHPPVKRKNSPVWKYFGFLKNAEGDLMEDGFPVCKMCHRRVAAKDGSTSNMMKHLRRHHQAQFDEVKSVGFVILLPEGDEPITVYPPSTPRRASVWKFFGFVMNSEGVLEENDFPICRLCHQVVASKDGKTYNMYSHLRHHHYLEYTEMRNALAPAEVGQTLDLPEGTELHPPEKWRNSLVWKHFGFLKNAEGALMEDGFPVCKMCHQRVTAKGGSTTNMAMHLRRHHQAQYEEMKKADAMCLNLNSSDADMEEKSNEQNQTPDCCGEYKQSEEEDESDEGRDADDSEYRVSPAPRRKRRVRSEVWKYFRYNVGKRSSCKICGWKLTARSSGSTSNMRHHLQSQHQITCPSTKAAGHFLNIPKGHESIKVYPPSTPRKSAVWKLFGFVMNSEGVLEENDFPVCRLCHQAVASKGGTTSNMSSHLRHHHYAVYAKLKNALAPAEVGQTLDLPEGTELHPPEKCRNSPVWKHFGFLKNAEGALREDGFPVCKLCHQRVTAKDGATSTMMKHLQRHHQAQYEEMKKADAMCLNLNSSDADIEEKSNEQNQTPDCCGEEKQSEEEDESDEDRDADDSEYRVSPAPRRKRRVRSEVWKYFRYNVDKRSSCKICGWKLTARSSGNISNMRHHLQSQHQITCPSTKAAGHFLNVPKGDESIEVYPPSTPRKSAVWKLFGFVMNSEGVLEENDFPVCRLCHQAVASKGGTTSNMSSHLRHHHYAVYAKLKNAMAPAEVEQTLGLSEATELNHPPEEELKSSTGCPGPSKNRSQTQAIQANPAELYPPKMALRSGVWKHFGYLKNSKGVVVPDGFPICKLCLRKVSTQKGCTTNMMVHLQRYHSTEFAEIRLSCEDNDDQSKDPGPLLNPAPLLNPGPLPDLFPPQDILEPVWEHFGYPKDTDGVLQVDRQPQCKICGVNVPCPEKNTKFLYKHLWKNHNAVYFDIKVATRSLKGDDGMVAPVLFPPTHRVKSAVWEYFGYLKDTEGTVICNGFPICKICYLNVAAKRGNTTNMFQHLKDHHKSIYDKIRSAGSEEAVPDLAPSVLYAPDGQNSKLWEYFECSRNEDGTLIEDGAPACTICGVKVVLEGQSTSNLMKHLQENHEVHAELQEALSNPSTEDAPELPELHPPTQNSYPIWEYFGFLKDSKGSVAFDGFPICKLCRQKVESKDGDTGNMFHHLKMNHLHVYQQIKPAVEKLVHKSIELCPPNDRQIDVRLWDHFGYPKNADGEVEEDGAPVCKLCLQKLTVPSRGANLTTSMMRHLRRTHHSDYEEIQEAIGAWKPEWSTDKLELYPPTQNVTSSVWEHFGYLKDTEGAVVNDGFPICRICHQNVPSKGGNTTNMFKHLQDCHQSIYSEIKSAVTSEVFEDVRSAADLHPPSTLSDQTLWEHFGYRKNSDGAAEEDGAPFCKLCLRKLVSRGETTKNMKQHLKVNHNIVYSEPEEVLSSVVLELDMGTSDLHPPTQKVKSAVWKFFGYPKDATGSVRSDGFPTCKLCQKKVSAKGGTTSNMFTHLKDYHRTMYNTIKATVRTESEPEPMELHHPPTEALSPVWKYFGYPKNADGSVACDSFPSCRLCQLKVSAKGGRTANMLIHLRAYHLDVYKEVKPAMSKRSSYTPIDLYPPTGQGDIKLWDHFGYPQNADGELNNDGAPICKICLRKTMKPPTGGSPTTNMLRHLRKKHQSVYNEVQEAINTLRTEWGIEPPELHPPTQNVTSAVWQYFGYLKDAEGSVVCDDFPICKVCQQKVASKGRCTTNMFKHLKDYHRAIYDEVRSAVTHETFEDVSLPTDLHPPSGQYNPKLWEHFGYRKTEEGNVVDDGAPICKLCLRKLISKGETTTNMMQHLKENHNAVYTEVQREVNPFTIGGATESPELHPPEHRVRSGVWKHFGYVRDEEGPADCAGFPICKICLSKVSNKGKVTANMTAHLKDHHRSVYDELKIPDRKTKMVLAENLPELHPPSNQPLSPIWEHFGFPKSADGAVEDDGCPVCRICGKKVSGPDRRKMLRHLHYCHFSVYKELKSINKASKLAVDDEGRPVDLYPPSKSVRSFVWKHFGYPKNPDGRINVDGRPICKMCFQKVPSNGGNTTNMFKHLEDKHGLSQ